MIEKVLHRTPLLRIAFVLILSIFITDRLPLASSQHWLTLAWGLLGLMAILTLAVGIVRHRPFLNSALLLLAVCCLGGSLTAWTRHRLERAVPQNSVTYEAILISEPVVHGKTLWAEIMVLGMGKPFKARASILRDTITNRHEQLHLGQGIVAYSRFSHTDDTRFTSRFDYRRWLQVHGFVATTFINHDCWELAAVSNESLSMLWRARLKLLHFRQLAAQSLRDGGLSGQEYAVVAAMALGDKSAVNSITRDSYSVSGASHVLALSGLHLSIIFFLLTFVFVRLRQQRIGVVLTLPIIWLFTLMVGLSPSVTRAATMLTICMVVMLLNRKSATLNTLSLAAIVLLIANPLSLWDVGFQLSFSAVLGILVFRKPILNLLHNPRNLILAWFAETIAVSCSAQLLTAPLVAYHFGRFSVYFLITNLIAIPLVTIILYLVLLYFLITLLTMCFGGLFSTLQLFSGQLLGHVSLFLNHVQNTIASWPYSSIEGISINKLQLIFIYVFLFAISSLYFRMKQVWKELPHD